MVVKLTLELVRNEFSMVLPPLVRVGANHDR